MPQYGDYDPAGPLVGNEIMLLSLPLGGTRRVAVSDLARFGYKRELLTAARTYYVRTDGNDNNDGRSNDAAGAFLTVQRAVDEVVNKLDISGLDVPLSFEAPALEKVTIKVADGTYVGNVLMSEVTGQRHAGQLEIIGNLATPVNVLVQPVNGVNSNTVFYAVGGQWTVDGFKLDIAAGMPAGGAVAFRTEGYYYTSDTNTLLRVGSVYVKARAAGNQSLVFSAANGSRVQGIYDAATPRTITVEGSFDSFAHGYNNAFMDLQTDLVLYGNPSFNKFLSLSEQSFAWFYYGDVDGACTGKRFELAVGSSIETWGAGLSYIPGSMAGTGDGSSNYDGIPLSQTIPQSAVIGLSTALMGVTIEVLSGNRTYYVRTDGNDNNTGLLNTAGSAFLTVQRAADAVAMLNLNGYDATVQLGDGVHAGAVTLPNIPHQHGGRAFLVGNAATPGNTVIQHQGVRSIVETHGDWFVKNLRVKNTATDNTGGDYSHFFVGRGGRLSLDGKIEIDNPNYSALWAVVVEEGSFYTSCEEITVLSTGLNGVLQAFRNARAEIRSDNISFPNGVEFIAGYGYFLQAYMDATVIYASDYTVGNTFVVNGHKYSLGSGARLITEGQTPSQLPGNQAGSTAVDTWLNGVPTTESIPQESISGLAGNLIERLSADRTYYVRTDGSDTNNGSSNDAAGAFLTIQAAVDYVSTRVNVNGKTVTVQVADGTYNETVYPRPLNGKLRLVGNAATPASVVIVGATLPAVMNSGVKFFALGGFRLKTMQPSATALATDAGGRTVIAGHLEFEPGYGNNQVAISCWDHSSMTMETFDENVKLLGNWRCLLSTGNKAVVDFEPNVLTLNAGALITRTLEMFGDSLVYFFYSTLVGSAVGQRYSLQTGANLITFGGGESFVPGSTAGSVDRTTMVDGLFGGQQPREILTTGRIYYVRTDGNDANNGLTNTAGGAFLTVQKAVDVVVKTLDVDVASGNVVTIRVADGTYAMTGLALWPVIGLTKNRWINITGNTATPANVVFNFTAGSIDGLRAQGAAANWSLNGITLDASAASNITLLQSIDRADLRLANLELKGNVTVKTALALHYAKITSAVGTSITLKGVASGGGFAADAYSLISLQLGTLAFPDGLVLDTALLSASRSSALTFQATSVTGAVTGQRYAVSLHSELVIGVDPSALPGTINGTLDETSTINGVSGAFKARDKLTADRSYYVRADGNDANTGLANTAGGAFATIQKAVAQVCDQLDLAGYEVEIHVADGTYNEAVLLGNVVGARKKLSTGNLTQVRLLGNLALASSCKIVTPVNKPALLSDSVDSRWGVGGFELDTTAGSAHAIQLFRGKIDVVGPLRLKGQQYGFYLSGDSALYVADNITVDSASMTGLIYAGGRSTVEMYAPQLIFTGLTAFGAQTVISEESSLVYWTVGSITGSATGKRYTVRYGSGIQTYGGGASAIPGNSAGTADAATFSYYS